MSMNAGTNTGGLNTGGLPRGELLGRYRSYEDAQKVVDHLTAAEDFDVKALTIVGNDLRSVEHIRTRLTYPRVALAGAAQGAMFGAFIGLLIYLFSPEANIYNLGFSVVLGMAIWMIIGVLGFAMRKGRREYASSSQLVATSFDVVCEFSSAHRARQLVAGAGVMSLNSSNDPTGRAQSPQAQAPHSQAPQGPAPQSHPAQQGQSGPAPQGQDQSAPLGQDAGAVGQQGSTTTAPTTQSPSAGYNDLPDGRPRYGVRAPQETSPQESGWQGDQPESAEHADARNTPGEERR
ncbi:general stress protein [Nesterenkonia lutea]|uniref:General stress protein 17M-like domain-containing protein n=1 Tax=Nesterenkonia lutea TaxID=272919 RepID=A0ABR9JF81_9MICC|nr:general stress protein [Nesterenkonia lutea]MBE1524587.1 hypothetical protein [Nesterenkonia lutea]